MPKKIIDILPPRSLPRDVPEDLPLPWSLKKAALAIFLLILLGGFAYAHFFLAKAEITLWPKTEIFQVAQEATVDAKVSALDVSGKLIPGKIFEVEKKVSREFAATGQVLKKAQGSIRLFNSYTTQAETWLAGTRFVSSEGKLFLSKEKIQVPGASLKNGKLTASFVDVPVAAAEGGDSYNIGPSNFSVLAFKGTPRFTSYHGESSEAMRGGGVFAQLTEQDLKEAENVLIAKAKAESAADFKKRAEQKFVLAEESQETRVLEKKASAEPGAETEKFSFELSARTKIISFELKDLQELARAFILSQTASGTELWSDSLQVGWLSASVNREKETMTLLFKAHAKIYPLLDLLSVKKILAGKSVKEAEILLGGEAEVLRSEVNVFPFWLKTVPANLEKIDIKLKIL